MPKFHNKVVDLVEAEPTRRHGSEGVFEAAQRLVRWHYRWVVVHDFLRRTVGADMLDRVLVPDAGGVPRCERRHHRWKRSPFMPVESSVETYRFGHSQIRGGDKLNTFVPPLRTFCPDPVRQTPLGLMEADPCWYLHLDPCWTPILDAEGDGDFTMPDLIRFSGHGLDVVGPLAGR